MEFLRGLPWKWIVPVLVILALGSAVRSYAGAMGRADSAGALALQLAVRLGEAEDSTASIEEALQEADSSNAAQARADSVRIAELDLETAGLERTVRELRVDDRRNAEGVDVALRDLGAVLSPGAVPALRQLTSAYEARITGLSDQVVALTGIVDAKDEEIVILEGELAAERFARGLADGVASGLRNQLTVQGELVATLELEVDALRDAVAPAFFTRLWQNAELALGAAVFGGAVVYLATAAGG